MSHEYEKIKELSCTWDHHAETLTLLQQNWPNKLEEKMHTLMDKIV